MPTRGTGRGVGVLEAKVEQAASRPANMTMPIGRKVRAFIRRPSRCCPSKDHMGRSMRRQSCLPADIGDAGIPEAGWESSGTPRAEAPDKVGELVCVDGLCYLADESGLGQPTIGGIERQCAHGDDRDA